MIVIIGDADLPQIFVYDSLLNNFQVKSLKYASIYGITFLKNLFSIEFVASSSADNTVNIWNLNTGLSILMYKGHIGTVTCLDQINEDTMVSGSEDNTIHVWKISTGELLNKNNLDDPVYYVKYLSNGLIACGLGGSFHENLRLLNYSTNEWVILYGHDTCINTIEVLSNQYMASGSDDPSIIIWDLKSYSIRKKFQQHTYRVVCMQKISSSLIASGDGSGLIIIWNWLNGYLKYKLDGHSLQVNVLSVYDEKTLISVSSDKAIKFWDIPNGILFRTINTEIKIGALAMLKRGKVMIFLSH
jgi:WD40 repeat protein